MSGGSGEHDANCGGARPAERPSVSLAGGLDLKRWLLDVLGSEARLEQHVNSILARITKGALERAQLTPAQVRDAVARLLVEPYGVTLKVTDAMLSQWMRAYGAPERGVWDATGFRILSRKVLEDRARAWFPPKLPAKTLNFVCRNPNQIDRVYEFGAKLGEGSFGKVYNVTHRVSGEQRVCKMIAKLRGKAGMTVEEILREIESMAMLDHPNVIKVYEYFETEDSVTQIMEPCRGGELQETIDDVFKDGKLPYDEAFICDVMKQTLRALAFMHGERFVHKDLKPQNIMLSDRESSSIKVIDFGLAELFEKDQKSSDAFGGTLLYMAPEMFRKEITMKVDIWAAGVILYNLVTGDYPFMAPWPLPRGKSMEWWQDELSRIIVQEPFRSHPRLANGSVSSACTALLAQMLVKDPRQRPDASACLEHPWFKMFEGAPPTLSVGLTQCLDAYAGQPELKKAIFLLIAHQCTVPVFQELRAIFTHFDVHNRGSLTTASLRDVLARSGMSTLQVEKIVHALDKDDSGTVEWTEFMAAALCISVCREKRFVDAAFAVFDRDQDGLICLGDFEDVFAQGAVSEVWRKQLPFECARLAGGSSTGHFTKEQFHQYVGRFMLATPGDALCAVD